MNSKQKKKILVICPHPKDMAPGQRLKYEQYFPVWEKNGYEITVSSFATVRFQNIMYAKGNYAEKIAWTIWGYVRRLYDLMRLPFYDVIYIFLWVTPAGMPLMERIYKWVNPHILYEIDDAIFLNYKSVSNPWTDKLKGRQKPFYLMRVAKQVITGTPYITETAKKYNSQVTDISVTIDTDRYVPVNTYEEKPTVTIGWSGSHSTSKFLFLIQEVLLELQKEISFKLLVMGDAGFHIEGLDIEACDWTEKSEIPTLQRMDIGLYPLPADDPWINGKSGGKALQYMSLGIPTVATAAGANYRVITHGVNGYLVSTKEEWITALRELAKDASLRRRMGMAAIREIEERFSIKSTAPVYLSIIKKVERK